jgi:ribonuclease BN (tRNA processing enzyme)
VPTEDRIVMLGLDGGPRLNPVAAGRPSAKPALALVVDDVVYLIDTGYDTARQLVASGIGFESIEQVFITHHHFDHTSGLPGVLLHGWTAPQPLRSTGLWGPPGMTAMVAGMDAAFDRAIELFLTGGGFRSRPALSPSDVALPLAGISRVMEDDRVTVNATRVFHGPEVADAMPIGSLSSGPGRWSSSPATPRRPTRT